MTPKQIDTMKLALEALEIEEAQTHYPSQFLLRAITAIKEALAEHAMQEVQRLGQEIEQEPVAWEVGVVDGVVTRRLAPPQRTWVGLTDEDYFAVLEKLQNLYHRPPIAIFAKAIEAKLKEKNCG